MEESTGKVSLLAPAAITATASAIGAAIMVHATSIRLIPDLPSDAPELTFVSTDVHFPMSCHAKCPCTTTSTGRLPRMITSGSAMSAIMRAATLPSLP